MKVTEDFAIALAHLAVAALITLFLRTNWGYLGDIIMKRSYEYVTHTSYAEKYLNESRDATQKVIYSWK